MGVDLFWIEPLCNYERPIADPYFVMDMDRAAVLDARVDQVKLGDPIHIRRQHTRKKALWQVRKLSFRPRGIDTPNSCAMGGNNKEDETIKRDNLTAVVNRVKVLQPVSDPISNG